MKICKIEGCEKAMLARQLCVNHYARQKRRGFPELYRPTLEERFWSKVNKTKSCWLWTASGVSGYGKFYIGGSQKDALSHRLAFEWANGPIPAGADLDHICHNRACVRPDHLRLTTRKQNMENRASANTNSSSGALGVHWHGQRGKWRARVTHNGQEYHGGLFETVEEAEGAVIRMRKELFTHNDADWRRAVA